MKDVSSTQSPVISDDGHPKGHYAAYTMLKYEIHKNEIRNEYLHVLVMF